jgi:hypothetical protein
MEEFPPGGPPFGPTRVKETVVVPPTAGIGVNTGILSTSLTGTKVVVGPVPDVGLDTVIWT